MVDGETLLVDAHMALCRCNASGQQSFAEGGFEVP